MKHFVVIDMQNDFCTGSLKNDAAVAIIPYIQEKLEEARKNGDSIVFTKDSHESNYLETLEGKNLPVEHCIINTPGWEIVDELKPLANEKVIVKRHFGYDGWSHVIKPGDEVVLCGTCTAICVASAALMIKAINEVKVTVLKDGCACISEESHNAALKVMECCQCVIA